MKYGYVALDTETIQGKAFLLSCADAVFEITSFSDFMSAMQSFITGRRKVVNFVWFNLDYDVTALLKYLPRKNIRELFVTQRTSWRGIRMRYFPGKYWEIGYRGKTFHHYDLYPFFQMSLDTAARKFLDADSGKIKVSRRALQTLDLAGYYRRKKFWDRYAMQDAFLLQQLADRLVESLRKIGHTSQHLYSPGYVAKQFWIRRKINFGWIPPAVEKFISQAFYGACVEIYQRGAFAQAWSYDVKSAYPWALSQLGDFERAEYYFSPKAETEHYFLEARVWMPEHNFYLLPVLKNGLICFPRYKGQIAYMTNEEHACLIRYGCDVRPIRFCNIAMPNDKIYAPIVREVFNRRKESGFHGLVYKLILNSSYGVTAETRKRYRKVSFLEAMKKYEAERQWLRDEQFIVDQSRLCPNAKYYWMKGCRCDICEDTRMIMRHRTRKGRPLVEFERELYDTIEFPGRMRNIAVAAKITALTRVKMYELKRLVPAGCLVSCFTDGIKTTCPLPADLCGEGLGDIGEEVAGERLVLVGCGVYQHGKITKLRGFHYKGDLIELMRRQSRNRVIRVPCTSRLTGMELVHEKFPDFDELNLIKDGYKSLDINFDVKRQWPRAWRNCADLLGGNMKSKALDFLD